MTAVEPPLISVIIPLYNAEKYIAECITSVLNQTWPNFEVVVIDDGSTDNSLATAKTFEVGNVKVLSQTNKGASAARNKGLSLAKGDYIQFLDADDLLKENKLEEAVKSLGSDLNSISVCPVVHFNEQNATLLEQLKPDAYELGFYKSHTEPFEFLLNLYGGENNRGGMIPLHCWLTPAQLIKKAGQWNETLTVNDDGEFFCRVVLQAQHVTFTDKTVCYYRKHTNNTSLSARKTAVALESQYNAILLKKKHLESFKADNRINKVIVHELMPPLMSAYPEHKQLSKLILSQIDQYEIKGVAPTIGGKAIELIKKIFGWKVARLLQYYNPFK